jgi:uncharacterized protein YutE (UPF0331/DUF86 family)
MLRADFIRRKLQLIAEELGRLLEFKDASFEEITGDFIKLAAVERILERIVNRAVDVNEHLIGAASSGHEQKTARLTYRETFLMLADLGVYPRDFADAISKSAGLRNVLVHEYNDVDRRIVYGSIRTCISQYREYIDRIEAYLTRS